MTSDDRTIIYTQRVSYADTDRMGFVHHSRYLVYMESARTELLRLTGDSYRAWEDQGILLPVIEAHVQYFKPGQYDDLLEVKASLVEMTRLRLRFHYEITCPERRERVAVGDTAHAFMNKEGRPFRVGPEITDRLSKLLVEKSGRGGKQPVKP